ncbi:hypothetical protein QFC22_003928 [Naganishia vaughanmartiniae]|uniref:Uncharacterized protein n=1 Tax=Naganishia vaughanmartiniae TaxID=1424756 RepID=A0ACC2X4L4_9TREE|nr:hypothetical protein QFC22_003928 [Naganishia vaughanmartiniae]
MNPIRSTQTQQTYALSPLQTFIATTPSQTKAQINKRTSTPSAVPAVVEEKLNTTLMGLTVLRGRTAELSHNMSSLSTMLEQVGKDLSDLKQKPALISDEQISGLVDDLVPHFRCTRELPDSVIHILQDFQNVPAEIREQLQDGLRNLKADSAKIKKVLEELLDGRDQAAANMEVEQDVVARTDYRITNGDLIFWTSQIPGLLQDLMTKVSPFEEFSQTAQQLLSMAKTLNTQVGENSPDERMHLTNRVPTSREMIVYSKEDPQAGFVEPRLGVTKEESERHKRVPSSSIDATFTLVGGCSSNGDRSLQEIHTERKIEREQEETSLNGHNLLQRLDTIENKLDLLLGMNRLSGDDDALESRPRFGTAVREATSTTLLVESDSVHDVAISVKQGVEATEQPLVSPENAQSAAPVLDTTECDMDLIAGQFPPLVPERNHAHPAMPSEPISDANQAPESKSMPGQPEGPVSVSLKRSPPFQTRSLDRSKASGTTPSRKRRLIKFSSDDEEDGVETVKRMRIGLSLDNDDNMEVFGLQTPIENDTRVEQMSSGASDPSMFITGKSETDQPEHPMLKANSGLQQSRRRISVSPDLL